MQVVEASIVVIMIILVILVILVLIMVRALILPVKILPEASPSSATSATKFLKTLSQRHPTDHHRLKAGPRFQPCLSVLLLFTVLKMPCLGA